MHLHHCCTDKHCITFPATACSSRFSQVRLAAANRYQAEMQAAAGAGHRSSSHQGARAIPPFLAPGYDLADTARAHAGNALPAAPPAARAAAPGSMQPPGPVQRAYDVGQAMAQVLLSMPMPRWAARPPGGSGAARRGLPASLVQMREAVLGMQRAGLPPHMLFSDRDFTAGRLAVNDSQCPAACSMRMACCSL